MMLFARTCSSFGFFCILGSLSISGFSVYFVLFYFWPPKISWVMCQAVGRGLSPWAVRARPKFNTGPAGLKLIVSGLFEPGPGGAGRTECTPITLPLRIVFPFASLSICNLDSFDLSPHLIWMCAFFLPIV